MQTDPCEVDVAHTEGHWFADLTCAGEPLDCDTLAELIEAAREARPDEALIFVVDRSTIEGHVDAEAQVLDAAEKSGAQVIVR